MTRRPFEDLTEAVAAILRERGYERLTADGYHWESGLNRVHLSPPKGLSPHFGSLVTREHYELSKTGERVLSPRQPAIPMNVNETPERIADFIEQQLTDPY